MKRSKKITVFLAVIVAVGVLLVAFIPSATSTTSASVSRTPGDIVDSLDGVYVYYNGSVGSTYGRNTAPDGYNIGLKYQCVEFVKRYYYEYYGHKMTDSYGHAVSFFDPNVADGQVNKRRGLTQYKNGGAVKPRRGDLVVYSGTVFNPYGHVAIVAGATAGSITIIQQNPGPGASSRETFGLSQKDGKWTVDNGRILGWLRKE